MHAVCILHARLLQSCPTLCDLIDYNLTNLSTGLSRQEYWRWLSCPPSGHNTVAGIEHRSLTFPPLTGKFFKTSATWEARTVSRNVNWYNCYREQYQFSHSVVSESLWPLESQHARHPCPSRIPGVHSDSRPSNQACHPAISSSVVPFPSCAQSLPASEYFPMCQLFA